MGAGVPISMSLIMLVLAIPVFMSAYKGIHNTQKVVVKGLLGVVLLFTTCWAILWTLVLLGNFT